MDVGSPSPGIDEDAVHLLLLALFRVLSFDRDMLSDIVSPLFLSSFLRHQSRPVRYLAIECLCMVMHFADAYSEKLIETYIGKEAIWGEWEGIKINYRLLKLWEERRWADLAKAIYNVDRSWQSSRSIFSPIRAMTIGHLSDNTTSIGDVLCPRPVKDTSHISKSTFVLTHTARRNLHQLGRSLLESKPILISGQASSGKTALCHEAARLLNQSSSMITLHLNEQTDAKSLLGLHTSSADGQSFTWQPGVLTKAMQQGRWVLIEDIDRAPAEIIGVLQPILQNGELFMPSRKERVRPKDGFRILATLKTSERTSSATTTRYSWLFNPRIWNTVETSVFPPQEVEALLRSRHPSADVFISAFLRVHENLSNLYKSHQALKSLQTRTPSLRDLLNLSRRAVYRLHAHGSLHLSAALPEQTKLYIFQDAVDCYAAYLNSDELHELVAGNIATSMDVSPQQMRYSLNEVFASVSEDREKVQLGRSTLLRSASRRQQPKKGPFCTYALGFENA